jgi:hypothetical protein
VLLSQEGRIDYLSLIFMSNQQTVTDY